MAEEMTYLVEGHCGGIYISNEDPDWIMTYCESCGDCDRIVAEWETGDTEAEIAAITEYVYDAYNGFPEDAWDVVFEACEDDIEDYIKEIEYEEEQLLEYVTVIDFIEEEGLMDKVLAALKETVAARDIRSSLAEWGLVPYDEEIALPLLTEAYRKSHVRIIGAQKCYEREKDCVWRRREKVFANGWGEVRAKAMDAIEPGFYELWVADNL